MKRIIYHWTASGHYPTDFEKNFYHFLIDRNGKVYEGKYKPEDNIDCTDGKYCAHTGGGNTGAIGIAFCGMLNFNYKTKQTKYPLTQVQCERGWKLGADLCKKYNLKPNTKTILTHYEFGQQNPETASHGKIDIIYLPFEPKLGILEVGSYIRRKVKWYYAI